jgi:hypothetical protein
MRCFPSTPSFSLRQIQGRCCQPGYTPRSPLVGVADQFLDNEFGQDDVNKFQSLATGARHVATLDSATCGDRSGSSRYRDIMAPVGLGDELRAALVTPSGC